jgi:anti-sigma28 factor (negative regulator of flagellin synthesis)|tara:strand:+ start:13932 stop:14231 length:300 start_codon:yes stop_codon:yes gene_type:complete
MSELSPLSNNSVNRTGRVGPGSPARSGSSESSRVPGRDRGEDRVEFSSNVQYLVELKNGGPVRMELVNRIRAEIEQGSYETPEKLEAAIDELLSDLDED